MRKADKRLTSRPNCVRVKVVCMCVQLEEALTLSQRVASMGKEAGEFLPRAYLSVGLCYSLKASEGNSAHPTNMPHSPTETTLLLPDNSRSVICRKLQPRLIKLNPVFFLSSSISQNNYFVYNYVISAWLY